MSSPTDPREAAIDAALETWMAAEIATTERTRDLVAAARAAGIDESIRNHVALVDALNAIDAQSSQPADNCGPCRSEALAGDNL